MHRQGFDINNKKQGQIEMIGLVIVVILLAIGFLFYVRFGILDDDGSEDNLAVEQAYVTNLMISLFNVNTCGAEPIQLKEGVVRCFNSESACGEDACDFVKGEIKAIMNSTSLNNYKNYSVWISKASKDKFILNECKTGVRAQTTIVSSSNDHYQAYFMVC